MRHTVAVSNMKYINIGIEPARASDADMSKIPLSDATDLRVTIDIPAEVSDPACPSLSSFLPPPTLLPSNPLLQPALALSIPPPPSLLSSPSLFVLVLPSNLLLTVLHLIHHLRRSHPTFSIAPGSSVEAPSVPRNVAVNRFDLSMHVFPLLGCPYCLGVHRLCG
eukprot:GHVU01102245.1.p1 GENE.GHVU01102245.1~~GHVU01102245.1.p1  ORF type:complete len:165 (-),score=5.24 GHVU01102245.1:1476-1970(-)